MSGPGSLAAPLSPGEQERALAALWDLLRHQAALWSGGDTSLTEERVRSLLASLLYTLQTAAEDEGVPLEALLRGDLSAVLDRGRLALAERMRVAKADWEALRRVRPPVPNAYYRDTLAELGRFFQRYDLCYAAHEVPCAIDYPLLRPVPEEMQGVSYVAEYLRRLRWESALLAVFDRGSLLRLYEREVPDWADVLFNFCDLPLSNAVGRSLLGLDPKPLNLTATERRELTHLLAGRGEGEIRALLGGCGAALSPAGGEAAAYFRSAAESMEPRLAAALARGDLSRIFVTFLPDVMGT